MRNGWNVSTAGRVGWWFLALQWVIALLVASVAAAQPAAGGDVPRTAWGAPDLGGVWDFRSITPFERPEALGDRQLLTDEDAAAVREEADETWRGIQDGNDAMPTGSYNEAWYDVQGVGEDRRTSLVVDPPNGRMPPLTAGEQRRQAEQARVRHGLGLHELTYGGWVADMGPGHLAVRCIVGFNSGPPMTPSAYNNNMQLFQTENHVVVLNEMVHSARVIPIDGQPHLDGRVGESSGDSRVRWEGDTLVVETRNFAEKRAWRGSSDRMTLVERFRRLDDDTLEYEYTVTDPGTWTAPWTVNLPMVKSELPLFEYACHEGNYSMVNILGGARALEGQADGR